MSFSKWTWVALAITALVFAASFGLRPMWRDEYWALYFSGLGKSLPETIEAIGADVHPPLYFLMLHFWRLISSDPLWVRAFNIVVMALGALAAWALRGERKAVANTYIFLCATSYWVLFFGVEARMMVMEFVLCALSVLVIRNTLDKPERAGVAALCFFALGVLASSAHFFGALWFAVAGAWVGLALLQQRRVAGFFFWAVASAAAIAPVLAWIAFVRPDQNSGALGEAGTLLDEFSYVLNQFSRGLVVKTLLCNVAATAAAFLCLRNLRARNDRAVGVIALAALSVVAIAFALHMFVLPSLIKERAFIVMMPGVLYLMAEAIESVRPEQRRARWLIGAIPATAVAALPLFSFEYFKDREQVGAARAYLQAHAAACAGQRVVAYYRPSEQAADFTEFFTRQELAGGAGGRDVVLVDAAALRAAPAPTTCPLKAIALTLRRGEGADQEAARAGLRAAGLELDALRETPIGKGRGLLFVAPD
jgi:uncharacterized membrane protein